MAQYENIWPIELNAGSAPAVALGTIYAGDHKANRCGAAVVKGGAPYALGGQCAGTAILADGSTVPLDGTIEGNLAYVELDSQCYSVEGPISVFVKWVNGTLETTLIALTGTVRLTETGSVIQPSDPIPDLAQLLAEIDNMRDATAAAEAAAAKSVRYDIGQSLTDTEKARARANIGIAATIDSMAVRYDRAMGLTEEQKLQARQNIDAGAGLVSYAKAQTLSDAQKTQARINIGAAQAAPTGDGTGDHDGLLIIY